MKKEIKNLSASIRARLLRLAKESNRDFNAVLLQYFQERFLYRLSISSYKLNFVLKGALLFLVYNMPRIRPTKDIDFLVISTANTEENLINIVREIAIIPANDGVAFITESLDSEIIKEDADCQGIRIYCDTRLGQAKRRIKFDFGFGDIIIPNPIKMEFPTLLPDSPVPNLITYTPESAVAEKFEAIIKLNYATSRMKDFYDIYYMANHYKFKFDVLKEAIETTFRNRGTKLSNRSIIYAEEFINDTTKHEQWNTFLNRMNLEIELSFKGCMKFIKNFIEPLFTDIELQSEWMTDRHKWIS